MSSRGFRCPAVGLAILIWGFAGGSAQAQSAGPIHGPGYGYGQGIPVYQGPPPGVFAPGYHGFGLDYGCERRCFPRFRNPQEPTPGCWSSYVLGKECLYPYVADPYGDPRAFGVWPPYSAPVQGTVPVVGGPTR
jgi:hypothetical protein